MTTNIQSFAGDVEIHSGNLSVKSLEVKDPLTKLGANNASHSNVGVVLAIKDGQSNIAIAHQHETGNIVIGYTNENVAGDSDELDILEDSSVNVFVYGNLYAHYLKGNGYALEGIVTDLQSVSLNGANTDQTVFFTNATTGINVSSNVLVSGNVTANIYFGDGGLLSNITQTLEGITGIGNTTPYTIECNNATTSLVTASNVGISNANPTADLCVGANVVIDDTSLNKIDVVGNVACYQLNLGTIEVLPAYSLENVTQISNSTTRTISFNNSTLAFETQKMAGIGIVPSSADVGVSGLHVDGHLRLGGEAENTDEEQMYIKAAGALGVLANESDTNNTNTELRLQSGDTNNSNITMVGKSSAQYMTFGTNAAERMRIDGSGNVGIGTNSPSAKFHIYEGSDSTPVFRLQANVASRSAYTMYTNSTDSKFAYCGIDGNGLFTHSTGALALGTNDTPIIFSPNYTGGEKMRIDTAGNVCIGGTNTKTKLHVTHDGPDYTDSIAYDRVRIMNRVTTGDAQYIGNEYGLQMGVSGTGNSSIQTIGYINSTDTVEAQYNLQLQPNGGYVGIGTTSPTSNLHVVGDAYVSSNLTVGTANLHVDTQTGFVGVGTDTPAYTLDVAGMAHLPIVARTSHTRELSESYGTGGNDPGTKSHLLLEINTNSSDDSDNSEYVGTIDLHIVGQRSRTAFNVDCFHGQLHFVAGWNEESDYWSVLEFIQETKAVNINAFRTITSVPRFKYKYIDRKLQIYIQYDSHNLTGRNSFVARVTSDNVEDITSHAGTDIMVTGTDVESILGVSYGTGGNVGIGTTNPTSNLHVVGDINLTSNIVMSGEVFIKAHDATSNHVAIGPGAGQTSQGTNAVAVGYLAGETNQHANTVVLNASGSALDTEGTGRTYIKPLRVATVASNVMTYDQTTGEVMDSGGLFTNRLAVVSEQPPGALTGATTTIQGHGKYVVTSSATTSGGLADWNIFNKVSGNGDGDAWSTGSAGTYYDGNGTHIGDGTLGGVDGEWLKLEMPYKTKLRHVSLAPRSTSHYAYMPEAFTILGSNDDSSWTTLKALTGQTWTSPNDVTYVIDASAFYKYYAIVVEETNGNFATIGEWRLFTESFSVDGGIVTTTAASGLETGFTEHPVAPLKGSTTYNANIGSLGQFPPSTHYVEGHGTYEAWASSQYNVSGQATREAWKLFDGSTSTYFQQAASTGYDQYNTSSPYEYVGTRDSTTTDVGGTRYKGVWVQLKLPYTITLAYTKINNWTTDTDRSPGAGVILGSNDGDNWYKLTEFTGLTYTSNEEIVQVNATTPYQYYRMVATNTIGSVAINFTEWRLFSATGVTKMDNVLISGELAVHGGALQTSHIKWPKVPLKANESEGYITSSSTNRNSGYAPWHAFNDLPEYVGDYQPSWATPDNLFSTGTGEATTSRTTGSDTFNHEWVQIQIPRAIQLSFFKIKGTIGSHAGKFSPKSGRLYASNDGVSWTKLTTFSNLTFASSADWAVVDIQATSKYTYFRWAITETQGGTSTLVQVEEIQLFESTLGVGTSATTAKLTVDGGLGLAKGSQVFAGSDVITEFPKHDRPLTKYPEVAMTADSSGGYTATASTDAYANTGFYRWKAFNNTQGNEGWHAGEYNTSTNWYTTYAADAGGAVYDTANYSRSIAGIDGEWLKLEVPNPVRVDYIQMRARTGTATTQAPKDFKIIGSNDDVNWDIISTHTGVTASETGKKHIVGATKAYKYLAIVVTRVQAISASSHVVISELEYWGTEEGDESVDIVHRSIPNTPGQQQLAVYYEARDPNSYSFADSTNVYDLSGNGVTGTLTASGGFDSEYNAFTSSGSTTHAITATTSFSGSPAMSFSTWVKFDSFASNTSIFYLLGQINQNNQMVWMSADSSGTRWKVANGGIGAYYLYNNAKTMPTLNTWIHVTVTYVGGSTYPTGITLYLNGTKEVPSSSSGSSALTLPSNSPLYLGFYNSSTEFFDGSISNFRLYSKALNADQVRELYEYDAERFGHRQNLVALHKGNLGVGVLHPTSRFEVAGADGLQEFPPKAMTGYETYIEGHGVFRASASSEYNEIYRAWQAFDLSFGDNSAWLSYNGSYDDSTDLPSSNGDKFLNEKGSWLKLTTPTKYTLNKVHVYPRIQRLDNVAAPGRGKIYASNDDINWTLLVNYDNLTYSQTNVFANIAVNSSSAYNHFVILVEELNSGASPGATYTYTAISGVRFFGTPAPSSLEDGHLTLGKALTLPRVSGHAAGAETPRAESLVVHYDTTVDSVVSGSTVVDISGEGNNGTLNGAVYDTTERALTFDGVDDIITSNISPSITGQFVHSFSVWLNFTALEGSYDYPIFIGSIGTLNQTSILRASAGSIGPSFGSGYNIFTSFVPNTNQWYHMVVVYRGGAVNGTNVDYYIDGVKKTTTGGSTGTLNIGGNTLSLGDNPPGGSNPFKGSISNFKLWNVALTAEEVAMEYALGRTGKSINLTDTALCLGGTVPRAQLDVRGGAMIDSGLVIKYKNSLEYARDGGIMLSRAGLGNVTNKYSSQPIVLDGGDSTAIDGNIRGGAMWSQWGGAQYGIAMRGASSNDTYPYLQDPTLFVTNDKIGIGTTSPAYTLDVNGLASSKTRRVFEFSGSDNYARHFWICSFLDAPGYHTNQLIKINYSVTYKRLTGTHSRNSLASGTVTLSNLWRYSTNGTGGDEQFVTLQDQKNEQYTGLGKLPKWYYVRCNNRGYLVLCTSISSGDGSSFYVKGNVEFLTRPAAEGADYVWNGTVYNDNNIAQTEGFTTISNLYPTTGTSEVGWDATMTSESTAQNFIEATEGTVFKYGNVGIGTTEPTATLDVNDTCYVRSSLITSKFHSLADNSTTARYVVRHATQNNALNVSLVIRLDDEQRGGFLRVYGTGGLSGSGGGLKYPQYALIFFSWGGGTTLHTEVAEEFETSADSNIVTTINENGYLTIMRTNPGSTSYMSLYVEAFYEGGIYI
jgi:hypothetical protein